MPFEDIVFWHWWIAGLTFVIFEMLIGGYFFLFIGVAAAVVGLSVLLVPAMAWPVQFVVWGVLSMVLAVGWRFYRKRNPAPESEEPLLNQRGAQYVGRHFTLAEPVVNGQGKIKVDDSTWKVTAEEDMEAGTKVLVTGADSTVLKVEAA